MNADVLKKAGIDYERGVKRFVGRAKIYEKVLSKFPNDSTFERISSAYAAHDIAQLFADAHEFKGVCGNIALTPLYDAADALVTLLRGGSYTPAELNAAYTLLQEKYYVINEAIRGAMEVSE